MISCLLSVFNESRLQRVHTLQGALRMLDVKLTDQFAGHEIAGHETTGHKRARYETGSDATNV